MVSAFAHAGVSVALGTTLPADKVPRRVWVVGALASALPDLDSIGFLFGVPYEHVLGHRGITHSIPFALVSSLALTLVVTRRLTAPCSHGWVGAYLFACIASHGLLDALTDGGHGIAFLAPFSTERWFLPWTPIRVSPIAPSAFFGARGLAVLASEAVWVGLPALAVVLAGVALRRSARPRRDA